MFLVDTDVLSSTAPDRTVVATGLRPWMRENSAVLFLSVITIGEIEAGICGCDRRGASQKATRLRSWLDDVVELYGSRLLDVDVTTAQLMGGISDHVKSLGHAPGVPDMLIAATAKRHGHTVLTRNLRHFVPMGVPAIDPFAALPPT